MPTAYTPNYSYYNGARTRPNNSLFRVFNVTDTNLYVYTFQTFNANTLSDSYFVTDANTFFSAPVSAKGFNNVTVPPFCTQTANTNVLKFTDVQALGKFNLYENLITPIADKETLYLQPVSLFNLIDKNIDLPNLPQNLTIGLRTESNPKNTICYNFDNDTKISFDRILSFKIADILCINNGFGANTFTECNILVSSAIANFMSNLTFDTKLVQSPNNYSYSYPNRLRAKVTGPSTANVGDVLEYTITLMNNDFSDTWSNPANVEVYPVTDAGQLSHRKVKVVNGTGKFKVDTKNLYSGDVFDVKVGWKYITNDSSVTVTIS